MALNVKKIERLSAKGRYRDSTNVYLSVSDTGAKSWLFRYERQVMTITIDDDGIERAVPLINSETGEPRRRERMMGLGSYKATGDDAGEVTLAEAREKRDELRKLLRNGEDPFDVREAQRAAKALATAKRLTFREAARQYLKDHSAKWSNAPARDPHKRLSPRLLQRARFERGSTG
jgi:hypothetical protein